MTVNRQKFPPCFGDLEAVFPLGEAGLRQTPEQIVAAALQEDVAVIGLSILSGAHMTLFPEIMNLLRDRGGTDIFVVAGGIIPEQDIEALREIGIQLIFLPGTSTQTIIAAIQESQ